MSDPRISIVVVNWNGHLLTRACLQSIEPQRGADTQVVVVDNGSTDGSAGMVRHEFPWATLVEAGGNVGFAEGCNRGIAASHGDWVVTLNNDATATGGWLDALRAATGDAVPQLGMLQCRMLFAHDPSVLNSTGVCLFRDGRAEDRDYGVPAAGSASPLEIFCPTAGAAAYRRRMLDEVRLSSGWFDGGFFLYGEDVDLGWRCRLAGWHARYLPDATVLHQAHATTGRHGWRFVQAQCARNRLRTLVKNASRAFLAAATARTAYDLVRIPVMAGPPALGSALRGLRESLRERAEVTALIRVPREEIERQWAVRRPEREHAPGNG